MTRKIDIRNLGLRLLWCQVISACFLFGAYYGSIGMGVIALALSGLILHYLLSQFSNNKLIAGFITLIWGVIAFHWGSWVDGMAATNYVTVILTLLVICVSFFGNLHILQWPSIDRWFQSPSSKD